MHDAPDAERSPDDPAPSAVPAFRQPRTSAVDTGPPPADAAARRRSGRFVRCRAVTAEPDEPIALDLHVQWSSQRVTVTPHGDIDRLTAPVLGAALTAVSDRHQPDVLLDLSGTGFMDAACLAVIGTTAACIGAANGSFALRSPGPMGRRLLALTELDTLIEAGDGEEHASAPALPDAAAGSDRARRARPVAVDALDAAASAAAAPGGLLDAALALVAAFAQSAIRGADGVSVALVRDGELTTAAASDETVAQMDRDQYAAGEGPCLSAAAEAQVFHVESVGDDDRWPEFLQRARAGGIGSILSTPLLVGARPVGSLNVYAHAPGAFVPADRERAAEIAVQAAAIVAETHGSLHGARTPTAHDRNVLAAALNERLAELGDDHPVPDVDVDPDPSGSSGGRLPDGTGRR